MSDGSSNIPVVLDAFYDKKGDIKLLEEQLNNLEEEYKEKSVSRQLKAHQGQQLDLPEEISQKIYEVTRDALLKQTRAAEEAATILEGIALSQGLDPAKYLHRRVEETAPGLCAVDSERLSSVEVPRSEPSCASTSPSPFTAMKQDNDRVMDWLADQTLELSRIDPSVHGSATDRPPDISSRPQYSFDRDHIPASYVGGSSSAGLFKSARGAASLVQVNESSLPPVGPANVPLSPLPSLKKPACFPYSSPAGRPQDVPSLQEGYTVPKWYCPGSGSVFSPMPSQGTRDYSEPYQSFQGLSNPWPWRRASVTYEHGQNRTQSRRLVPETRVPQKSLRLHSSM